MQLAPGALAPKPDSEERYMFQQLEPGLLSLHPVELERVSSANLLLSTSPSATKTHRASFYALSADTSTLLRATENVLVATKTRPVARVTTKPKRDDQVRMMTWDFNIFILNEPRSLQRMAEVMFNKLGLLKTEERGAKVAFQQHKFVELLKVVEQQHRKIPFHSFQHAVDVTHAVFFLLEVCNIKHFFTDLEILALMTAALFHDIDHPGVNNTWLIRSNDPLGVRYNRKSVAENHHAAMCWHVLLEADILSDFDTETQDELQRLVIGCILATDMSKHVKLVSRFEERLCDTEEEFSNKSAKDRELLMKVILKAADISFVGKRWGLCKKWSGAMREEFRAQGLKEKRLSMPVCPLMAADNNLPRSLSNFIIYVAQPFFKMIAAIFPEVQTEILPRLEENLKVCDESCNSGGDLSPERSTRSWSRDLQGVLSSTLYSNRRSMDTTSLSLDLLNSWISDIKDPLEDDAQSQTQSQTAYNSQLGSRSCRGPMRDGGFSPNGPGALSHAGSENSAMHLALQTRMRSLPVRQYKRPQIEVNYGSDGELPDESAWGAVGRIADGNATSDFHAPESYHALESMRREGRLNSQVSSDQEGSQKSEVKSAPPAVFPGESDVVKLDVRSGSERSERSESRHKRWTSKSPEEDGSAGWFASDRTGSSNHDREGLTIEDEHPRDRVNEGGGVLLKSLLELDQDEQSMFVDRFDLVQVDFETWRRMQGENALENAKSSSNNSDAENSENEGRPNRHSLSRRDNRFGKRWANLMQSKRIIRAESWTHTRWYTVFSLLISLFILFGENARIAMLSKKDDAAMLTIQSLIFMIVLMESALFSVVKPYYLFSLTQLLDIIAACTLLLDALYHGDLGNHLNLARMNRGTIAWQFGTRATRLALGLRITQMCGEGKHTGRAVWVWMKKLFFKDGVPEEIEAEVGEKGQANEIWQILVTDLQTKVVIGMLVMAEALMFFEKLACSHTDVILRADKNTVLEIFESIPLDSNRNHSALFSTFVRSNDFFSSMVKHYDVQLNLDRIVYYGQCATGITEGPEGPYSVLNPCSSPGFRVDYPGAFQGEVCDGVDICDGDYRDLLCESDEGLLPFSTIEQAFESFYPHECPPNTTRRTRKDASRQFRRQEIFKLTSLTGNSEVWYSMVITRRREAWESMLTTLFLALWTLGLSFVLGTDMDRLLITPLNKILKFVRQLTANPFDAAFELEMQKSNGNARGDIMEMQQMVVSLHKITRLLKVALGEAGIGILKQNLTSGEDQLLPMIPGKRVRACFGFCDIRDFTPTTESLQEDIMMFVNEVAGIVHEATVRTGGAPNKNIGDAFLCVWKIVAEAKTYNMRDLNFAIRSMPLTMSTAAMSPAQLEAMRNEARKEEDDNMSDRNNSMDDESNVSCADRALLAWLVVMEQMTILPHNFQLRENLCDEYVFGMGFGLHLGWAIEGAIGSEHKLDPSYLSPHVNITSRLENATKLYGVPLLMSAAFYRGLESRHNKRYCRKIDCVTVKGSNEKMLLYTFDIWHRKGRVLYCKYSDYKVKFEDAVDLYLNGDWTEARIEFLACKKLWPSDHPIEVLLEFMGSHQNLPPPLWAGFRALTEK
eukprot:CAMPEP_0198225586 /NCGR_PEP_ID=MMETSP1445-20131203/101721_1 /TAXON_ID=36898 /ORGANISM="Pyramimonas sp., Strain CCMP2087" /LENGTH=1587 /DNA_ID=CAMNT_0043905157 /DNA_START=140 /DNA_END=4903 /DNA_ORIENTATION=+